MTYQFFKTMMRFCFPEKDPETLDGEGEHSESSVARKGGGKHFSNVNKTKRGKESSFYVPIEDDVEKMKVCTGFYVIKRNTFLILKQFFRNEPRRINCSSTSKFPKSRSKFLIKEVKRRTSKTYTNSSWLFLPSSTTTSLGPGWIYFWP